MTIVDCANGNPAPRGTRKHPDEVSEKFTSLQTDSGAQLGAAIRGQEQPAPVPASAQPFQDHFLSFLFAGSTGEICVSAAGAPTRRAVR